MKRRDFLKSVSGIAAGAMVPAPRSGRRQGDARSETLLIVSEGGPNNLDIHGIGTNVPGYCAVVEFCIFLNLKLRHAPDILLRRVRLNLSRS